MGHSTTARCGAELRSLETENDYEQCLALQRMTWGDDFRELVPPTIIKICQKVGGIAAGAFEAGEMLAFVYGLSGVKDRKPVHWSHMLAVVPEHRGRGLGRDLKLYQRQLLTQLGIGEMYWTFDPLIARNANLNLQSLGARPVEYVEDMYGADTGSEVHSGLGTDRFVVRWALGDASGDHRQADRTAVPMIPREAEETETGFCTDVLEWIEIPSDIDAIKHQDMKIAEGWRTRTRTALTSAMERGAGCRGLLIRPSKSLEGDARYFYVFEVAK